MNIFLTIRLGFVCWVKAAINHATIAITIHPVIEILYSALNKIYITIDSFIICTYGMQFHMPTFIV